MTELQTPQIAARGAAHRPAPRHGAGPDSVWNVRERLEENFRRVQTLLGEMESEQDPKMRLAAAAELRQHIALAEKTLETASRAEAVRAFEDIVISALAEASLAVRRRVLERLRERHAHGRNDAAPGKPDEPDGGEVCGGDAG